MATFFRPEWNCGRYHKSDNRSMALLYNKLDGMSFLFEDESADIINIILKYDYNDPISISSLFEECDPLYTEKDIVDFCEELINVGLLTSDLLTGQSIEKIRRDIGTNRINEHNIEKVVQEKLPFVISSAENDYSQFIEKDNIPFSVMIELTYNCNEQCIHCYNPGASRNVNEKSKRNSISELTYNDYEKLLFELENLGVVKISLTGGESFAKKDIWKIIELIHKLGFSFDIFTNGLLLENVNNLLKYFPQSVRLSVYSANEDVHDSITRVTGSLVKTLKTAKELQINGVPIFFNCPIMKNNVSSYHTVYELSKEYGAIAQFDVNLADSVDGDLAVSNQLQVSNDQLEILLRDPNIPLYVGKEAPGFGKKSLLKNEPFCGAGINVLNITPEGHVTPCNAFPASFGNLKENGITEIISNSESLKKWQAISIKDYDECGTYDQCWYCNRCPGQSYIEHGSALKKSSTNHNTATVRFNLAHKLMNGNDPLKGLVPVDILSKERFEPELIKSAKTSNNHRNKQLTLE